MDAIRLIKPSGHLVGNRKAEIVIGIILFLAGSLLLYDAFDKRGKAVPWPISGALPW
jgi:hypothetical protein